MFNARIKAGGTGRNTISGFQKRAFSNSNANMGNFAMDKLP